MAEEDFEGNGTTDDVGCWDESWQHTVDTLDDEAGVSSGFGLLDFPGVADWESDGDFILEETIDADQDDGFTPLPSHVELFTQVFKYLTDSGMTGNILAMQAGQEADVLDQALGELRLEASTEAKEFVVQRLAQAVTDSEVHGRLSKSCLLYTSPSPRDS